MTGSDHAVEGPPCVATRPLSGEVRVPGDKSIGHRSLLIGALCDGPVEVTGLSHGEDNLATARILGQLGVRIERGTEPDGTPSPRAVVHGVGLRGFSPPAGPLDCGNSGTTMRLMLGILAGQPFEATLVGDASLSRRPMRRVLTPLAQMGLEVLSTSDGGLPPLKVRGRSQLKAIDYATPVASAQIKSAILLAGLYADGETRVSEPEVSRDHTERMLAFLGRPPRARALDVPGDLSSAAFVLAAGLLVPHSDVTVRDVGVNPTRTGLLDVLTAMGAAVEVVDPREVNGEPRADLRVTHARLRATSVSGALAVQAIDELPLIATLAARADGVTRIRDAAELRVKESDRIARTAAMLRSFGVTVDELPDGLDVQGAPDAPLRAGDIHADGDHRIAMCATILGLVAPSGTRVRGADTIASSFPSFYKVLRELGVRVG